MYAPFKTIGVTGPTGSGKSSLHPVLARFGCAVIDCDRLARQVVEPGQPALCELADAFGADVLLADGSLDRGLLAQRAFSTPEGHARLCAITHPRIIELAKAEIAAAHADGLHAVIDAPLLFEAGIDAICDITIAVLASAALRLERIMRRDGITEEAARLRMSTQQPDSYYSSRAHHTLLNDGTAEDFERSAYVLLESLLGSPRN